MTIIYTIGFTKRSAKSFFEALRASKANRLLDIRLHKTSQLAGFSKRDDLRYFLKELIGMDYCEVEAAAPEDSFLKQYRKDHDWGQFEQRYRELLEQRNVAATFDRSLLTEDAVLLCSEAKADKCHRRLFAEYLAERVVPGGVIRHL